MKFWQQGCAANASSDYATWRALFLSVQPEALLVAEQIQDALPVQEDGEGYGFGVILVALVTLMGSGLHTLPEDFNREALAEVIADVLLAYVRSGPDVASVKLPTHWQH